MNVQQELQSNLVKGVARKINELIAEALCKKLKLDSVNVLDYKNRMAKTPWGAGNIVSLDAEPILYIELVPNDQPLLGGPSQDFKIGITIKWRFYQGSV